MWHCGCWIVPFRRTAERGFPRTHFSRQRGQILERCDLPTGRTRFTPKRLPEWNSRNGAPRRRPSVRGSAIGVVYPPGRLAEEISMPPLVVETAHSLKELVGQQLAPSDWFIVTQDRIQRFADATEDRQWIHTDHERARRESPYGATIAHGFLTLSLLSHFLKQALQVRSGVRMAVNYGLNRVRFPSPVRSG